MSDNAPNTSTNAATGTDPKSSTSSGGLFSGVTNTLGAAVGGVSRTAGEVVGAAGRGVGETFNNTTGTKAFGDGLQSVTNGVQEGTANLAKGVEPVRQDKKE